MEIVAWWFTARHRKRGGGGCLRAEEGINKLFHVCNVTHSAWLWPLGQSGRVALKRLITNVTPTSCTGPSLKTEGQRVPVVFNGEFAVTMHVTGWHMKPSFRRLKKKKKSWLPAFWGKKIRTRKMLKWMLSFFLFSRTIHNNVLIFGGSTSSSHT